MNSDALVSVIIPCYNHERFVAEAINSVLTQSYSNIELIVVDDGSSDGSVSVIEGLQKEHGFKFHAQQNRGLSATLNWAISTQVKGKYTCIVASDDYWANDKIALQVNYMEANPKYTVVFSNAYFVNNESEITGEFNEKRLKHNCTFEDLILDKCGIPALTTMMRTTIYRDAGLYDETLAMEDWDLWLRISAIGKIAYLPEKTAYYRTHDTNISSNYELMMQNRMQILDKWKDQFPEIYSKAVNYWKNYAFIHFSRSDKQAAKKYLQLSAGNLFKRRFLKAWLRYTLR
ncbi:MAG: glycosyltransferase [Pedobacter sp.]|nr:MAG: glycosyltransferase [Pedobacter sp.]